MKITLKFLAFLLVLFALSQTAAADKMDWWKDAKFGMFIHWGIYAVPARGEWVMNQENIPIAEYEKFAEQFNPVEFNADDWVQVAKQAGQKYLVITSKHHDGFCMWDSKISDYDIIDRTPFKRDVIRELADACEDAGIVFGIYHSILDWHHPDALAGRIRTYRDNYLFPQVQELIENYRPKILWFDGDWQSGWSDADARALYNLCISLDPDIIVNDRVKRWMSNPGDYVTPEQEIPEKPLQRPWESCQTINWNWGYNKNDNSWKTPATLVHMLLETVSKGGNLLLNVGPTAEGIIPAPSVDRLKAMGSWLDQYGETVYGSVESPIQKVQFGRVTYKENIYYLDVFSIPASKKIEVPFTVTGKAVASDYKTGASLPVTVGASSVGIDLASVDKDPYATVITFEAEGEPVLDDFVRASSDGSFILDKTYVFIVGSELRVESQGNLGFWTRKDDYAYWKIFVDKPGAYKVSITYAVDACCGGNRVAVTLNEQALRFTGQVTGGWQTYKTFDLGTLNIPEGLQAIAVKPDGNNGAYINLMQLILTPDEQSTVDEQHADVLPKSIELHPVFPNPSNGGVTIRYTLPADGFVDFAVYDVNGRSMEFSASMFHHKGEFQRGLETTDWPTGLYFLTLKTERETKSAKFLLVK